MPTSAFFAVLRDTAKLAAAAADDLSAQATKLGSAADDIAALTGKAAAKTAGVAGDDLAVGAGQVSGISPSREIPAVLRIMRGSAVNKAFLIALLLLVSAYAPALITLALVFGGLYLAYEGGEGLLEKFHPHPMDDEFAPLSEDQKVRGAIRTDLILSLEILVISLATVPDAPMAIKAGVLVAVGAFMTVLIYGLILVIIRLDDVGMSLARQPDERRQRIGKALVQAAPKVLKALDPIGMLAMFAVAGGIFSHLVHIEYPHWSVGLAADAALGAVVGLALAALYSAGRALLAPSKS